MNYDLAVQKLLIKARVTCPIRGPVLLSKLRSLYEESLAALYCRKGQRCPDPVLCPFHTAFAQELSPDPDLVRRHQKPPHPFSWHVPLAADLRARQEIQLCLVLIGRAALQIAAHTMAVRHLFEHPELQNVELTHLAVSGASGSVCSWPLQSTEAPDELPNLSWEDLILQAGQIPSQLRIVLTTPLRLMNDGKPLTVFEPSRFLRTVIRRCSALAAYYGTTPIEADFRSLSSASTRVRVTTDQSRRISVDGRIQGITGSVDLMGDFYELWPWLQLGQLVNVGKGAAFGYGQFKVENV